MELLHANGIYLFGILLSAEMNIPLSLPENMPNEDDEDEEQEEGLF